MTKILSGMLRVITSYNHDDIMISGVVLQECNANLEATLKQIKDHNLTLRKKKREFGKTTIEFHSHAFTSEELRPRSDKIRAVEKCEPVKNRRVAENWFLS